jgi:hypothetical protein
LFFHARGGSLGRSVLLVDEISKAASEKAVYGTVVELGRLLSVCQLPVAMGASAVVALCLLV